jgi:DNA-binding IclR family transcriptional regulator
MGGDCVMGQVEILRVLNDGCDSWFSAKDLSRLTGVNKSSVNHSTVMLVKFNIVECKKDCIVLPKNRKYHIMVYKIKQK